VRFGDGEEFAARQFADSIHLEGAETLATFTSGIFEGQPAATLNRFGKGRAIHLGARFPLSRLRSFFSTLLDEQKVPRIFDADLPPGVYATRRKSGDGAVVFLMNFSGGEATIDAAGIRWAGHPDEGRGDEVIRLPRFGLRILHELE
jgi:beta-galactosidase